MFYDKAICCFKKEFFFSDRISTVSDLHVTCHFIHAARISMTFSLFLSQTPPTTSGEVLKLGTSQLQNAVTVHHEVCACYRDPPPPLPLSLSAHGKIHSTADSSVFAVFITSYARVTARMRLLVHFTTTTYAWYECWAPGILHSPSLLTFLSTTSPRVFPSFTSFVCCHAPFWWSAEARVNGRTYEEL